MSCCRRYDTNNTVRSFAASSVVFLKVSSAYSSVSELWPMERLTNTVCLKLANVSNNLSEQRSSGGVSPGSMIDDCSGKIVCFARIVVNVKDVLDTVVIERRDQSHIFMSQTRKCLPAVYETIELFDTCQTVPSYLKELAGLLRGGMQHLRDYNETKLCVKARLANSQTLSTPAAKVHI